MRHGVAFRKLSRNSSHRNLLLRNLVSSLFQHEQIKTTLPKAKEASRVAEWVITWGKRGTLEDQKRARAFLMNPETTMPKLFKELSARYASRAGGYTRVHRFGNRKGDHAPNAILELVDNPNDIRFSMTAKAVGREMAKHAAEGNTTALRWAGENAKETTGVTSETDGQAELPSIYSTLLRPQTYTSLKKALTIPTSSTSTTVSSSSLSAFQSLAREAFYVSTAISKVPEYSADEQKREMVTLNARRPENAPVTVPGQGRKIWAGQEAFSSRQEEAEEEWEDVDDEAEQSTLERRARLQAQLGRKQRHPEGRNGARNGALSRAKGHFRVPRANEGRRTRVEA